MKTTDLVVVSCVGKETEEKSQDYGNFNPYTNEQTKLRTYLGNDRLLMDKQQQKHQKRLKEGGETKGKHEFLETINCDVHFKH